MAYITFTHVDVVTGIPVTEAPARNGPAFPVGAIFGFALESLYPTPTPVFYGTTKGKTDLPGILSTISKAEYDAAEAAELKARADKLRVQVVTMRQAKLALLYADLLDDADAAIAALTGTEGRAAQIEWEYASELRRDHPMVAQLGMTLGLDDAAIDALFAKAAQIA